MKKNTCLLIALILGAVHLCINVFGLVGGGIGVGMMNGMASNLSSNSSSVSSLTSLSGGLFGLAAVLSIPHLILTAGGVTLSALGLSKGAAGQALAAGICFVVAVVTGFSVLVLAAAVLSFVAYAQMNKSTE